MRDLHALESLRLADIIEHFKHQVPTTGQIFSDVFQHWDQPCQTVSTEAEIELPLKSLFLYTCIKYKTVKHKWESIEELTLINI